MHLFTIQFKIILFLLGLFLSRIALAQENIQLHEIEIAFHKTSSLIFPAVIKSVDRGSRDLIAQKAKEVENVLQLKAGRENFPETNLTVITADGMLHQFTVNYAKNPETLSMRVMANTDLTNQESIIFQSDLTESNLERYAQDIIEREDSRSITKQKEYKITLALNGIYICDNTMFFHFRMSNHSNINYDVDFLRLFIEDKQKMKRTASQELDIRPMYTYGNDKLIPANSEHDVVYALNKFTIPDAKNLMIEMFEQNGGRHLTLSVKNKQIVNAQLLP